MSDDTIPNQNSDPHPQKGFCIEQSTTNIGVPHSVPVILITKCVSPHIFLQKNSCTLEETILVWKFIDHHLW